MRPKIRSDSNSEPWWRGGGGVAEKKLSFIRWIRFAKKLKPHTSLLEDVWGPEGVSAHQRCSGSQVLEWRQRQSSESQDQGGKSERQEVGTPGSRNAGKSERRQVRTLGSRNVGKSERREVASAAGWKRSKETFTFSLSPPHHIKKKQNHNKIIITAIALRSTSWPQQI